jgi:hypothetical protein
MPVLTDHNKVIHTGKGSTKHLGYHGYEVSVNKGGTAWAAMTQLALAEGLKPKDDDVTADIAATANAVQDYVSPSVTDGSQFFELKTRQPLLHKELLDKDPTVNIIQVPPSGKQ